MNKSILIVICDFLVSAMLTMMTGMVPAHSGGTGVGLDENTTKVLLRELDRQNAELEALRAKLRDTVEQLGLTPEREAELRRLAERIAENKVQQQKLRKSLEATPQNTGKLTPEELQKQLEAEQREKIRLEIELSDSQQDRDRAGETVQQLRQTTAELTRASASLRSELSEVRSEASAQREELARERRKHDATRSQLDTTRSEHAKTQVDLAHTRGELDAERRSAREQQQQAKAEVRRLNDALGHSRGESEKLQRKNAQLSGRLSVVEQNHATASDRIVLLERQIMVERMKSAEAQGRAAVIENTLKTTVTELSAIRAKEQIQLQEKARAQAQLEAAQKMLAEKGRPVDVALKSYGGSVVRISCEVAEKAAFRDRSGKTESLYPVVDFGGTPVLVGLLNRFAGDDSVALSFKDVTKVDFKVSSPLGGISRRISGLMHLLKEDLRIAGFPYRDKNCTPLKLITAEKLINRGLNGLYLFKCTSGSSAPLNGRASLSLTGGKQSLFIRNAGRANNELKAEPGDIVITSEGEFVGIAVESAEVDDVRGARVMLFTTPDTWKNTVIVQLDKMPGEKFFTRYGVQMRHIRTKVRPSYDKR